MPTRQARPSPPPPPPPPRRRRRRRPHRMEGTTARRLRPSVAVMAATSVTGQRHLRRWPAKRRHPQAQARAQVRARVRVQQRARARVRVQQRARAQVRAHQRRRRCRSAAQRCQRETCDGHGGHATASVTATKTNSRLITARHDSRRHSRAIGDPIELTELPQNATRLRRSLVSASQSVHSALRS